MSKLRVALAMAASVLMTGSSFGSDLGPGQLGAAVDLDGTLITGIGVASVARAGDGTKSGEWVVTFRRDLTGCVWTGSIGYGRFRGFTVPAFISVNGQFGTTNALYVQTFNGKSRASQDWPFNLTVLCG